MGLRRIGALRDVAHVETPRLTARECCALAVVLPTVLTMRRLAARADDYVLHDLFTADRAFHIIDNRRLIGVDEFNAFGVDEHQLVK